MYILFNTKFMKEGENDMHYRKSLLILIGVFMLSIVAACSSADSSGDEDFPTNDIEIVAPATLGVGWDKTYLSVLKVFYDNVMIDMNINVVHQHSRRDDL